MPSKDFSIEELDQMYDEANAWTPPAQTPGLAAPAVDPKSVLQKLMESRQPNQGAVPNQTQNA